MLHRDASARRRQSGHRRTLTPILPSHSSAGSSVGSRGYFSSPSGTSPDRRYAPERPPLRTDFVQPKSQQAGGQHDELTRDTSIDDDERPDDLPRILFHLHEAAARTSGIPEEHRGR